MLAGFNGFRKRSDTNAILRSFEENRKEDSVLRLKRVSYDSTGDATDSLRLRMFYSHHKCNKVYMKRCFKVETIINKFLLV
jgi:hypothetical protein